MIRMKLTNLRSSDGQVKYYDEDFMVDSYEIIEEDKKIDKLNCNEIMRHAVVDEKDLFYIKSINELVDFANKQMEK